MNDAGERIAEAFRASCRDELDALKPGNVHRFAPGHGMEIAHFLRAAEASAPAIAAIGERVGTRLRRAAEASVTAAGLNANLGILLLCAPLAAAFERGPPLRDGLRQTLRALDAEDAAGAFAAIRAANPGGLGAAARHDVRDCAPDSLLEAMREAAARDRIARAYVADFDDVFAFGLPTFHAAAQRYGDTPWATTALYLGFLSAFPDTHVARKQGPETAEAVRREAGAARDAFLASPAASAGAPALLAFDASLKQRGVNPGTSADFTVATLFARRLERLGREPLLLFNANNA